MIVSQLPLPHHTLLIFNWEKVSVPGFNNGNTIAVVNDTIYVGSGFSTTSGYLWKSIDKGLNWQRLDGPTDLYDTTIKNLPINDISIVGLSDTLYIAAGNDTGSAFVVSYNGGKSYNYINFKDADSSDFTSVVVNQNNHDSIFFSEGNSIYLYDRDSSYISLQYEGLVGEETNGLVLGSILVGTTTGFYSVDMEPFDDGGVTSIIYPQKQTHNLECLEFPNPVYESKHLININCNIQEQKIIAELYNLFGQKLEQYVISTKSQTIELPKLRAGVYIIKYKTSNDLLEQKIIVQ